MTIAEVKQLLGTLTDPSDAHFSLLRSDTRKGVIQAISQWEKKLQRKQLAEEQFQERLQYEKKIWDTGKMHVAGIDEVGRGPLAGPVVAAAIVLPSDFHVLGVNDSKQLSAVKREELFQEIKEAAIAIGIGVVSAGVIDQINIYEASKKAMIQAVEELTITPDHLLIDAMRLPLSIPQEKIIKGDAHSISIGAASIIAKVTRDRMMMDYDKAYPGYGFAKNAGYGTKEHLAGLKQQGPSPIHRLSFAPVREAQHSLLF